LHRAQGRGRIKRALRPPEILLEPDPIGRAISDILGTLVIGLITALVRSMAIAVLFISVTPEAVSIVALRF